MAIDGTAHDNTVINCSIGTNKDGDMAVGNNGAGVLIGGKAYGNTIGGNASTFGNVISGNIGDGVDLIGGSQETNVAGNWIGVAQGGNGVIRWPTKATAFSSTPVPATSWAARSPRATNVIQFNRANGVLVQSGAGNSILGNSIFKNGLLGIALGPQRTTISRHPFSPQQRSAPCRRRSTVP